jgi:hypothetical protein
LEIPLSTDSAGKMDVEQLASISQERDAETSKELGDYKLVTQNEDVVNHHLCSQSKQVDYKSKCHRLSRMKKVLIILGILLALNCSIAIIVITDLLPKYKSQSSSKSSLDVSNRMVLPSDGTFRITVFEDLHFGEAEDLGWGPAADVKTIAVMNKILDMENQQLVVLNGDLITGENVHKHNGTRYLDQIVKPLVQRGIPWASTYGNHDRDYNLAPWELLDAEKRYSNYSLTRQMVYGEGVGTTNYYVPIYSSDKSKEPALLLWFFDSRGGRKFQRKKDVEISGTVHPKVSYNYNCFL